MKNYNKGGIALSKEARRLLCICLFTICLYLVFTLIYADVAVDSTERRKNLIEMLRSVCISFLIAEAGTVVLDCDIKHQGGDR